MRKVFDTKAGASFNTSSPRITYSVRQKELEIIFKFNKGFFCIINVFHTVGDKLLLAANWGKFFDVSAEPKRADAQSREELSYPLCHYDWRKQGRHLLWPHTRRCPYHRPGCSPSRSHLSPLSSSPPKSSSQPIT